MNSQTGPTGEVDLESATLVTYAERPELDDMAWKQPPDAFPEYNYHGDTLNKYWSRLAVERPEFQFCLLDRHGAILARCESLPLGWDGTLDDLPAGLDGVIARGFEDQPSNALCAMAISVPRSVHGRELARARS